jgi:exodeoxyribonuclease V alpha subunit
VADVSARTSETEALAGLVERVTFHNAENGFCVLRALITVVGYAATIAAGEFVQLSGGRVHDCRHSCSLAPAGFGEASFCQVRLTPVPPRPRP